MNPPLYYSWAEERPETPCTFHGSFELDLSAAKVTVDDRLRSARLSGRATVGGPEGDRLVTLPIRLSLKGVGAAYWQSDTFTWEQDGATLSQTTVYGNRDAAVSGAFGKDVIGNDAGDATTGQLHSQYTSAAG